MDRTPANPSRRQFVRRVAGTMGGLWIWPWQVLAQPPLSLAAGPRAPDRHGAVRFEPATPPPIPNGLDAYRLWTRWPLQRLGARATMHSTYDRHGGNEGSDASHFLYMGRDAAANVVLDVAGPGELVFARANRWHGSPWHYIVDGHDTIVQEAGTLDSSRPAGAGGADTFIPQKPFPRPLAETWRTTKGSDLLWVPIGFRTSLQIAYGHTHYGTGYFIVKKYANERRLTQPIRPWSIQDVPDTHVLDLVNRSGTDIAPLHIAKRTGSLILSRTSCRIARIQGKPSVIRAIKLSLPLKDAQALERARLQIVWDNATQPSIDAPLCLFFAAGTFYNRDRNTYLVKGFPINIRFDYAEQRIRLACYFPMPFFTSADIRLQSDTPSAARIDYEIRYEPCHDAAAQSSYFHATYRDFPAPRAGHDLVLLDTKGIEGHALWSGSFVGTSLVFSHNAQLATLEGDPRFYFDDSRSPQAQGTGTEEWCGGGDYWRGQTVTLPFVGHPTGASGRAAAKDPRDLIESAYRFLLADAMPFGRRAQIHLEHGGRNQSTAHYESVTYWYGLPSPSLILTDALDVGSPSSEQQHDYRSPGSIRQVYCASNLAAAEPAPLSVGKVRPCHRTRWSDPTPGTRAAKRFFGRHTRRQSAFSIALTPDNFGVLIRRTLDYRFPNQKAAVEVADADRDTGRPIGPWQAVGTWFTAGSTTVVYSNPATEDGARIFDEKISPDDLKDDEFLISENFARGRSALRLRFTFIPMDQDLYPGHAFPRQSAWSEIQYQIYACVMPRWPIRS